jgi:hypothetical protein
VFHGASSQLLTIRTPAINRPLPKLGQAQRRPTSNFRWAASPTPNVGLSLGMTLLFLGLCAATVRWIFKAGYRLKN